MESWPGTHLPYEHLYLYTSFQWYHEHVSRLWIEREWLAITIPLEALRFKRTNGSILTNSIWTSFAWKGTHFPSTSCSILMVYSYNKPIQSINQVQWQRMATATYHIISNCVCHWWLRFSLFMMLDVRESKYTLLLENPLSQWQRQFLISRFLIPRWQDVIIL